MNIRHAHQKMISWTPYVSLKEVEAGMRVWTATRKHPVIEQMMAKAAMLNALEGKDARKYPLIYRVGHLAQYQLADSPESNIDKPDTWFSDQVFDLGYHSTIFNAAGDAEMNINSDHEIFCSILLEVNGIQSDARPVGENIYDISGIQVVRLVAQTIRNNKRKLSKGRL